MPASSSRGFTLIELLVVMSLIIILSALAMVQYRQSVVRSREAVSRRSSRCDAIDRYYADKTVSVTLTRS